MNKMSLTVPAKDEWGLVFHSALSAVGVLANLSVDMIADLRSASDEAFELLTHQSRPVHHVEMDCELKEGALFVRMSAHRAEACQQCEPMDPEVAHLILGALATDVRLEGDSCGIYSINMTLPAVDV